MKRHGIWLAVACLVVPFAVVSAETEIEQAPLGWQQAALSDGEALYAELCAVCHGVTGAGDGPAAPALSVELADLRRLAAMNEGEFPAARVEASIAGNRRIVAHGTPEMPVWGSVFVELRPDRKPGERWALARTRIYNLTEYLRSLQVE